MKGDFSRWDIDENKKENFNGVLHQQGRVLLDNDWNAATRITNAWQEQAGQDIIGPGVAAVPAEEPDSFKVVAAEVVNGTSTEHVELDILPGRVWADGLLTFLTGEGNDPTAAVKRTATYLGPPFQDAATDESSIGVGVRDAVILEVWQEAVNGFQIPRQLLEPALGGPDTTERVHTSMAFRLLRLEAGDRCEDVADKLKEDPNDKGSLIVTLAPPKTVDSECPVEEGGGYTGFEHHLYRIEMAQLDETQLTANGPMFKWSRFNGGLVGRGEFSTLPDKVKITANFQAITTGGLTSFYLEAVEYDRDLGHWRVTFGTSATLNADNELDLTGTPFYGTIPVSGAPVFFRLWDGIQPISDFPPSTSASKAKELENGIRLEFDSDTGDNYQPGDYWTFEVRAGGIGNPPISIPVFSLSPALETDLAGATNSLALQTEFSTNGFPISGSAVVTVQTAGVQWLIADTVIEESYIVKKEAGTLNVYHLTLLKMGPPDGIRYHRVPLAILEWNAAKDIDETSIHDCRRKFRPLTQLEGCCTVFVGKTGDFHNIQAAVNHFIGTNGGKICVLPGTYTENVLLDGARNIFIFGCGERSKIISKPPAGGAPQADPVIHVLYSVNIRIQSLAIEADDSGVGILLSGSPIEESLLGPAAAGSAARMEEIQLIDLDITAASRSAIEAHNCLFTLIRDCRIQMKNLPGFWPGIFFTGDDSVIENNEIKMSPEAQVDETGNEIGVGFAGRGGLQVGGTSDRVRIINNLIQGGTGSGITLGHILEVDENDEPVDGQDTPWVDDSDPCFPCRPGGNDVPPPGEEGGETRKVSAGALSEIYILRNRILGMGFNGIGVAGFFNLEAVDEFITVEGLTIQGNEIRRCLGRPLRDIPDEMSDSMGYGGIALADVEYLVIDDNVIEDNGPDHLEPVCGIYVLHGQGIDIFDNRILNNGAKTGEPAMKAKSGARGGIYIVYAVAPTENIEALIFQDTELPRQNGFPAARVHDNIVSTPLGRALSMTALGPVSVVGNQFTSRGMVLQFSAPGFIAAAVAIVNLGVSNEFYGQLLLFALRSLVESSNNRSGGEEFAMTDDTLFIPRKGLDDLALGQFLANGNVMFNSNQCTLDLLEKGPGLAVSSIFIISLDDISFQDNQCDCSLLDDFIFSQAILLGLFSLRVKGNRFKEGLFNALLSGFTMGLMNMTSYNQATHCIWVNGLWGTHSPNTVLWSSVFHQMDYCEKLTNVFGDWRG